MALWDAAAKIAGLPIFQYLGERLGENREANAVRVYPGGGGFSDDGVVLNSAIQPPNAPGVGFETRKALKSLFDLF